VPNDRQTVVVAVLWRERRMLLQLRDFSPAIADPGEWGFFGGHLERDEPWEAGLRRELTEELGCAPDVLTALGTFEVAEGPLIVGYRGALASPVETLVLGEGQEIGAFAVEELRHGSAYSKRWRRRFPLTQITRRAIALWCGLQL
jgi:8-oxo-dGTP diphosphatase